MRQGAQDWCTGMTLRDGMGRDPDGLLEVDVLFKLVPRGSPSRNIIRAQRTV